MWKCAKFQCCKFPIFRKWAGQCMLVYILFSALNRQVKLCTVFCDVTVHSVLSNLWVFFVLCHTMKEKNATFVSNSFLVCIASCPFDFCTFLCDPTAVALLCQTFFLFLPVILNALALFCWQVALGQAQLSQLRAALFQLLKLMSEFIGDSSEGRLRASIYCKPVCVKVF